MPENTVYVGRPGKWGNPFKEKDGKVYCQLHTKKNRLPYWLYMGDVGQVPGAMKLFRDLLMDLNSHDVSPEIIERIRLMRDTIKDLQGKNLACFCPIGQPCHADALLELTKTL